MSDELNGETENLSAEGPSVTSPHINFNFNIEDHPDLVTALNDQTERARKITQEANNTSARIKSERAKKPIFSEKETSALDYRANFNDNDLDISTKFKAIRSTGDEKDRIATCAAPGGARILNPLGVKSYKMLGGRHYDPLEIHLGCTSISNNEVYRFTGISNSVYSRFYSHENILGTDLLQPSGGYGSKGVHTSHIVDRGAWYGGETHPGKLLENKHFLNDVFGLHDWDVENEKFVKPVHTSYLDRILFEYSDADCDSGYGKYQQYAFIPLSLTRNSPASVGHPNFEHTGKTSDWESIKYAGAGYDHNSRKFFAGMHYDALSWKDFVYWDGMRGGKGGSTSSGNIKHHHPWSSDFTTGEAANMTLRDLIYHEIEEGRRRCNGCKSGLPWNSYIKEVVHYTQQDDAGNYTNGYNSGIFTHPCDDRNFYNSEWADKYYSSFKSPQNAGYAINGETPWRKKDPDDSSWASDIYPVNMKRSAAGYDAIYGGAGPRKNDVVYTHTFAGGKQGKVFRTDKTQKKFNYVTVEYVFSESMQANTSPNPLSRYDGFGVIYEKCPIVERDGKIYLQTKNAVWWKQFFPWWYSSSTMGGDAFPGLNNLPPDNNYINWVNIWAGGDMETCAMCQEDGKAMFAKLEAALIQAETRSAEDWTGLGQSFGQDVDEVPQQSIEDLKKLAYVGHLTDSFKFFSSTFESTESDGTYTHTFRTKNPRMFDGGDTLSLGYYWLNESDRDEHAYTKHEISSVTHRDGEEISTDAINKLSQQATPTIVNISSQDQQILQLNAGYTQLIIPLKTHISQSSTSTTTSTDEEQSIGYVGDLEFTLSAEYDFSLEYGLMVNGRYVIPTTSATNDITFSVSLSDIKNQSPCIVEIYSAETYTRPLTITYNAEVLYDERGDADYKYKLTSDGGDITTPPGLIELDYGDIDDVVGFSLKFPILHSTITRDSTESEPVETISNTETVTDTVDLGVDISYENDYVVVTQSDVSSKKFTIARTSWGLSVPVDLENIIFEVTTESDPVSGQIIIKLEDERSEDMEWLDSYSNGEETIHTFTTQYPVNPVIPAMDFEENTKVVVGRQTPLQSFISTQSNFIDSSSVWTPSEPESSQSMTENDIQSYVQEESEEGDYLVSDDGSVLTQAFFDDVGGANSANEKVGALLAEQFSNLITMQYTINEGAWLSSTDTLFYWLDMVGGVLDGKWIALKGVTTAMKLSKYAGKAAPYMSKIGKTSTMLNDAFDLGAVGKVTGRALNLSSHTLGHGLGLLGKNHTWWKKFTQWLIKNGVVGDKALTAKYANAAVDSQGRIYQYPGFLEGVWDNLGLHKMPYGRSKVRPMEEILHDNRSANKFFKSLLDETDHVNSSTMNSSAGSATADATGKVPDGAKNTINNFFDDLMDRMGDRILKEADPHDLLKTFDDGTYWNQILNKTDSYSVWRGLDTPTTSSSTNLSQAPVKKGAVALTTNYKGKEILLPMEIIPAQHRDAVKTWLRTNPQKGGAIPNSMQKFIDEHMEIWQFMHKLHLLEKYVDLDYTTLMRIVAITDHISNPVRMTGKGIDWTNRASRADLEKSVLRVIDTSAENYKLTKTQIWSISDAELAEMIIKFERNFKSSFKYLVKNNKFMQALVDQNKLYDALIENLGLFKKQIDALLPWATGGVEGTKLLKNECKRIISQSDTSSPLHDSRVAYLRTIVDASDDTPAEDFAKTIQALSEQIDLSIVQAKANARVVSEFDNARQGDELINRTVESSYEHRSPNPNDSFQKGGVARTYKVTTTDTITNSLGQRLNSKIRQLEEILVGAGEEMGPQHIFYVLNDPAAAQSKLGMTDEAFQSVYDLCKSTYRDLHHMACSADSALDDLAGYGLSVSKHELNRIVKGDEFFSGVKNTREVSKELLTVRAKTNTMEAVSETAEAHVDALYEQAKANVRADTRMDPNGMLYYDSSVHPHPIPIHNRAVVKTGDDPANYVLDSGGLPKRFYTLERVDSAGNVVEVKETDKLFLLGETRKAGWRFKVSQEVEGAGIVPNKVVHYKRLQDIERGCKIGVSKYINECTETAFIDDYIKHITALKNGEPSPFTIRDYNKIQTATDVAKGKTPTKYTYGEDGVPVIEKTKQAEGHTVSQFAAEWCEEQAYQLVLAKRRAVVRQAENAGGYFMDVEVVKLEGGIFKGDPAAARGADREAWKKIVEQGYDAKIPTGNAGEYEYVKLQQVIRHLDSEGHRGATSARQEFAHGAAFTVENGQMSRKGIVFDGSDSSANLQVKQDKLHPREITRRNIVSVPVESSTKDPALALVWGAVHNRTGIDVTDGAAVSPKHGSISNIQLHLNDVIGQPKGVDGVVGGKPRYTTDQLEKMLDELNKLRQSADDHVDELLPGPDGKRQPNIFTISADSGTVKPKGEFGTTIADSAGNEKWLPGSSLRAPAGVMNHYCSVWEGCRALRIMEDAGLSASTMNAENIAAAVHRGWGKSSALRNVDEVELGSKLGRVTSENPNLGMQTSEQIKEFAITFENLAFNNRANWMGSYVDLRMREQVSEFIDIFVDAGFDKMDGFPQNHRRYTEIVEAGPAGKSHDEILQWKAEINEAFDTTAQTFLDWLNTLGGMSSPMKWENGRYAVDGIPLPFGGTSIGVEYRIIEGPGGTKLYVPDTKVGVQKVINTSGQGGIETLTYDTSNWKKYLEQMVKTNRAATQADSFSKLSMGDKILDLPTVIVLLKQNPELLQTWMQKSGKTWDELQNMLVYRDPKTGEAVTLDLFIGAKPTDAVTLNVPVKRGDSVEWLEVVLSPPKTVAEVPNGAVGGVKSEGWDVVMTKGSDEARFANSAITDIIRHGNIADNLLKLKISKIFARGRFIEEFLKNLPGPNMSGSLRNGAVMGLFFLAHSGFYQKLLRGVSGGAMRSVKVEGDVGRNDASLAAVSANWKWNTSMKPAVGLLFAPLSIWFNGYYHIGQEMLSNPTSGSITEGGDEFLENWNTAISGGAVEKGIPQEQMCSFFQYNESANFHLGVQFTWQEGQVGWAIGMPLVDYIDWRISKGQTDDDADEVSDWQEGEFDRLRDACISLENNPTATGSNIPPIRYLVKTGEMGVPLHGTLVGNSEIMDVFSKTKAGMCWSKPLHDERKWGYYAEDDDGPDIELLSQDACYACWPAHFPEAFCKGRKGPLGGDENLTDYPCDDNLEADSSLPGSGWTTAQRYPGFNQNAWHTRDTLGRIDVPGDFTPIFDD
tara:strand:+ start:34597 stop:44205 length:9609 start_codon:yes stop_codon:yes gene_type:complete